jgi:integrase
MPVETLSSSKLKTLKPPATGFVELWDDHSRGLCLRVFASGKATWTFRYRPKDGGGRKRIGLGEYPNIGLAEARKRVDHHRGKVSDGGDPQAERRAKRDAPALTDLIERYLAEEVEPKKKPATVALYRYHLRSMVGPKLGSKKAIAVTHSDVAKLHRELGEETPVSANRAIVTLSGVYTFAAKHSLVPEGFNPARRVEKFKEQGRERYLSNDELGRLGSSLRLGETEGLPWPRKEGRAHSKHDRNPENRKTVLSPHVTAAFRLLLFTGCRLREILRLRWSEIDFERGLLLLPDSKTGRKAVVLNAAAVQVLTDLPRVGEFVVAGDSIEKPRADIAKPWNLIRHHADLDGVRVHDLRHTHASVGAGAGLGLPIIGKLLGHKHPETTAKYAHLDTDPLRRASDRIGGTIEAALGEAPSDGRVAPVKVR